MGRDPALARDVGKGFLVEETLRWGLKAAWEKGKL